MLNALGMRTRPVIRQSASVGRRGFTMVEMALTLCVIGILTAMMIPKIGRVIQANQVSRSAAIVAADLEQAFTLAGRNRRPMRLSCTCGTGIYTVADRAGGTVRLTRNLRGDGDFGTMTLTFSQTPVDVFPSGVVSITTPPLTVRITSGVSTRAVTMTTAGQVRIIP
jgi:prepilin-type N-terminal cleavage/methylation domain-containing protein